MLKIRLTRIGKKHQPTYRIVVTPKENPAQGQYIDLVGTYNPIQGQVSINNDKAVEWLNKGAQPSERVARLLSQAGVAHNSVVVKQYTPKPKEEPVAEAAPEAAPAEEAAEEATVETPTESTEAETPAEEATEPEATEETA